MYSPYIIAVKERFPPGVLAYSAILSTQRAEAGGQHWHPNETLSQNKDRKMERTGVKYTSLLSMRRSLG